MFCYSLKKSMTGALVVFFCLLAREIFLGFYYFLGSIWLINSLTT